VTPDEAVHLLRGLGRSSKVIAASLKRSGIRGKRGDECRCPLAIFLRTAGAIRPEVFCTYVFVRPAAVGAVTRARLPSACQTFLRDFDDGRYPALERK
jgi:hypothetical protein